MCSFLASFLTKGVWRECTAQVDIHRGRYTMPKKRTIKVRPRAERARILAEAKAKGLTAEQVEKRYGVSKWTYYGWKKRAGTPKAKVVPGAVQSKATGLSPDVLRKEIRAMLPGILHEEIARVLGSMLRKRAR